MNKIIYIALFGIAVFSCQKESYDNLQRNSFVKFFGSQYTNTAEDILEDNGDYVFVGTTLEDSSQTKGYIAKTNEFGNTQWRKMLPLPGKVELHGITIGNDFSYVVCGEYHDSTGQIDVVVAKFSSGGTIQWYNTFGGMNDQIANKIVPANDGGYVLIGSTNSADAGNGNPLGNFDVMACKINENGDSLILNQFGGSNQDYGNDIVRYNGNQYYAVGTSQSFEGAYDSKHGGKLIYIIQLSNQLGEDDAHCWGDAEDQTGNCISYDNNGNLLVGGGHLTIPGGVKVSYILNIDATDIRVALDSIAFSTSSPDQLEEIFDLRMNPEGIICATGQVIDQSVNKIAVYHVGTGNFSLINSFALGFEGNAYGDRVIPTSHGGFLIAGSSLYQLNSKAVLVKLNPNVEL